MSKQKQKDSSNLVDVQDMAEVFQDSSLKIQLEKYEHDNLRLAEEMKYLKARLEQKDAQLKHMEELLKQQIHSYAPILDKPVSDEEIIALKQLERIKEAALTRTLSLEEAKIYDLFVKNKRLAQGDSTGIIDTVKIPKEKTKLLEIASKKINEPTE